MLIGWLATLSYLVMRLHYLKCYDFDTQILKAAMSRILAPSTESTLTDR